MAVSVRYNILFNFSCNLASGRRRLKPFNMQDACMTRWGVLLPQGERSSSSTESVWLHWEHSGTRNMEPWDDICSDLWEHTVGGVLLHIRPPSFSFSHMWLPCWLCTWMFQLFSLFVANVCTHILNRFCTLVARGLYFMNCECHAKSLLDKNLHPL